MTRWVGRNCGRPIEEGREQSKGIQQMARSSRPGIIPGGRQISQSVTQRIQTIILEDDDDDDDDMQPSSPRALAQARTSEHASRQRNSPVQDIVLPEDHLELRLGPSEYTSPPYVRLRVHAANRPQLPARGMPLTIDLTNPTPPNDDCIIITEKKAPQVSKRKRVPSLASGANEQSGKELRLTCPICMDVMKEETSTICGHLFCRECIFGAIASQKKCPTCRHKLTIKCTHRIYLTGSLRNS